MYTALRATTRTVIALLNDALQGDPELRVVFEPIGTMSVSPNTPQEMSLNTQSGLSVWLYRVVRDEFTLNAPPRRVGFDEIEYPPLPLRLHYLMTPVLESSADRSIAEMEQSILGMVMQTLNDNPVLRGAQLQGDFSGTDMEINVRFEPMELEEITRIWDSLENSYQLSVSYEISIVPIASSRRPVPAPVVTTVESEYGVILGSGGMDGGS